MMKLRSFYSLAILLFFAATLSAQTAKLERAQRYMKELNYVGAIELLNQMLAHGDNAGAKIALADCYRKISDPVNAEFLYGQVVRLPEAQPIHFLYYGEMLQRNGKCDLAREWYQKFYPAGRNVYIVQCTQGKGDRVPDRKSSYQHRHFFPIGPQITEAKGGNKQ